MRDFIKGYIDARVRAARVYHWAKELGKGMPTKEAELDKIYKEMEEDEMQGAAS